MNENIRSDKNFLDSGMDSISSGLRDVSSSFSFSSTTKCPSTEAAMVNNLLNTIGELNKMINFEVGRIKEVGERYNELDRYLSDTADGELK